MKAEVEEEEDRTQHAEAMDQKNQPEKKQNACELTTLQEERANDVGRPNCASGGQLVEGPYGERSVQFVERGRKSLLGS